MGSSQTLFGGAGDDSIIGGTGGDIFVGGAGNDTFVLEAFDDGLDFISDFTLGEDKIIIQGEGLSADDVIFYNNETGELSVNGNLIANIRPGLNLDAENIEFNDGDFDIF